MFLSLSLSLCLWVVNSCVELNELELSKSMHLVYVLDTLLEVLDLALQPIHFSWQV